MSRYNAELAKENYYWHKNNNWCVLCHKNRPEPSRTMCYECLMKRAEYGESYRKRETQEQKEKHKESWKKDTMSIVNKVYVLYAVSSLWTKNTHFALNILLHKENEVGVARKRKKSTSKSVCVLLAVVMSQLCRENALVKSITSISAS